tara:strand:+ start:642 stop:1085 length:444 start_codon:yes stop_codon:yes gene_type:complete
MEVFDKLKKDFYNYKFENELKNLENSDLFFDENRITKLKIILNKKEENTDKNNNKNDDFFDDIINNAYQKKWTRLNIIHKKNRIKNYLLENIKNKKNRENINNELYKLLDNKKLNTKNIEYNFKVGKIIKINILKFNEKENSFFLTK